MDMTRDDLLLWLHRLDAYTNEVYGRALSALGDECVTCGRTTTGPDANGLCPRCNRQSVPDDTNLILFRPLRQPR